MKLYHCNHCDTIFKSYKKFNHHIYTLYMYPHTMSIYKKKILFLNHLEESRATSIKN